MHITNLPIFLLLLISLFSTITVITANPLTKRATLNVNFYSEPCANKEKGKQSPANLGPDQQTDLPPDFGLVKSLQASRALAKGEQLDLSGKGCEEWVASFTADGNAFRKLPKGGDQGGWKERKSASFTLKENGCYDLPAGQDVGCAEFKKL